MATVCELGARRATPPSPRSPQRSGQVLRPYMPYVIQRWREGCTDSMQLWREWWARGYGYYARTISRFLTRLRRASEAGWAPETQTSSYTRPQGLSAPGRLVHLGVLGVASHAQREVRSMTFVIAEPCIDVMDQACVRVCPVACIHGDANKDRKLYIDPQECIDCRACEPACPVEAISHEYDLPTRWLPYSEIDALWFRDPAAARARVAALKDSGEPALSSSRPLRQGQGG